MKRVTGIGGIFFKCKDPKKIKIDEEIFHQFLADGKQKYLIKNQSGKNQATY